MPRNIHRIIEKQMNRWRIQSKGQEEREREFSAPNMITLSNALGSRGSAVADRVGELLDVPVYDREIVEHIATTASVRVETVQTLDQLAQSRLDDYLTALFRERNFDQGDYLQALTRTIMALWGHGSCVMVGRGACHIIYRKNSLTVRVIAPDMHRLRQIQRADECTAAEAQRRMERTDAERASFIRRLFGEEITDPLNYDLVINTAGMAVDACSRVIVEAYKRKIDR